MDSQSMMDRLPWSKCDCGGGSVDDRAKPARKLDGGEYPRGEYPHRKCVACGRGWYANHCPNKKCAQSSWGGIDSRYDSVKHSCGFFICSTCGWCRRDPTQQQICIDEDSQRMDDY